MTVSERELKHFNMIAQQLRIPEFKYRADAAPEFKSELQSLFEELLGFKRSLENDSLVKTIHKQFPMRPMEPGYINLAFTIDRLFDVWLRKIALHPEMKAQLSNWRIPFFSLLYQGEVDQRVDAFIKLVNQIASDCIGWSPRPARSKHLYQKAITALEQQLFSYCPPQADMLEQLLSQWKQFVEQQTSKRTKVTERLAQTELASAKLRFAEALSQDFLNQRFNKRVIPESLQDFIERYWLDIVARSASQQDELCVPESLQTLTDQALIVFTKKGEAAFQASDTLLDDLNAAAESYGVSVPDEAWSSLQADILELLQKRQVKAAIFRAITTFPQLDNYQVDQSLPFQLEDWFVQENDEEQRVQCCELFETEGQVLLGNYLGMKQDCLSVKAIIEGLKTKRYRKLALGSDFVQVLKTTLSGLLKVASTQKEARVRAAEKARQEAERLLQERERAEQEAKQRAEDIAKRTREIQLKKEEKKRLEKEAEILSLLSTFKLGAWIAINEGGEKKRFKLAVKFSASKKYLFVDKLGIRKTEFEESELVKRIIEEDIEILSDGADFEDSLERVVSRIRISK